MSAAAAVLALMIAPAAAQTQSYPNRSVQIVNPTQAGATTDVLARVLAAGLSSRLGQQFVIVNRAGAGGAIGTAAAARADADGYTLWFGAIYTLSVLTKLKETEAGYEASALVPVCQTVSNAMMIVVRGDSPYRTLADLAKALKEDPGSVTIGTSSSAGGANHIAAGLLAKAAGADVRKLKVVIYNGGGEALAATLGGHVTLWVNSASSLAAPTAAGTMRTLAIAAPQRLPGALASLPTAKEAGLPMVADNWRLVIAPKGLSAPQVAYWDNAFRTLTQSKEWNDDLAAAQMSNSYRNSADTTSYIAGEYGEIRAILTELGLAKAPK